MPMMPGITHCMTTTAFVTQLENNAQYRVIERRTVLKIRGLTRDQPIECTGAKTKNGPIRLRRIGYKDADTGPVHLADQPLYIGRQHQWSEQNLKIQRFLGTSKMPY